MRVHHEGTRRIQEGHLQRIRSDRPDVPFQACFRMQGEAPGSLLQAARSGRGCVLRRSRVGAGYFRADKRARQDSAPPVRDIRARARVRKAGCARPQCPRDQADTVQSLRQVPDHRIASRGGAARQAGNGTGRAQGEVRRGEQHQLGENARECGLPRYLRPCRTQDAQ